MRKTDETYSVILHHCRLRLSPAQSRWLAPLLAQPGHLVADSELLHEPLSWKQIIAIRQAIEPHGLALYRVKRYGFVLLSEKESS